MVLRRVLLLAILLLTGCEAPQLNLAGEWQDGPARLTLAADKTFAWSEDGHTLTGTYAKVGATVYVQPEAYDGKSLDAVNLQAMEDAIRLGKQTDLSSVSSRFDPREFAIEGTDTLRMKPVPVRQGETPIPVRVFKRVSAPSVD